MKAIFTSMISFNDAAGKALRAGYIVIGNARNQRGEFVVFGRRN